MQYTTNKKIRLSGWEPCRQRWDSLMIIHPLITMVIMSITYYNMVGLDMEFWTWLHWLSCQFVQNGFIQRLFWSTELIYYSLRPEGTWNFRVQAKSSMEYGLEMKSYENKTIHVLYHKFVYSDPNKHKHKPLKKTKSSANWKQR